MNIRYSARARVQIELIHDYIAERNAVAASVVVAYIRQVINFSADWPHVGHITDEKGVRALVVPRFPYVVFYKIGGKEIIILSVMHTAQER